MTQIFFWNRGERRVAEWDSSAGTWTESARDDLEEVQWREFRLTALGRTAILVKYGLERLGSQFPLETLRTTPPCELVARG